MAMLPYYYGLMSMLSSNAMTHGANANGVKVKGKKKSRDQEKKTVESLDNLTAVTTATSIRQRLMIQLASWRWSKRK